MVQVLILNTDDFIFPDFIDCHKKGMFSAGGLGWCGESGLDGSCSAQYALRYSVLWLHQHITSSSTAVAQCWILTNVTTHNLISLQHYTCTPLPSHCLPHSTLVPVCTFYIHLTRWVSDGPLSTMMDEHLVRFILLDPIGSLVFSVLVSKRSNLKIVGVLVC